MIKLTFENILQKRLQAATRAELDRLCFHLDLKKGTDTKKIEKAYLNAADNSIFNAIRNVIPNDAPTYSKVLRLIFNEMRPYSVALNETLNRIKRKRFKFQGFRSEIEYFDDKKLEEQILSFYAEKHADVKNTFVTKSNPWKKASQLIPGGSTAAVVATIAPRALALPLSLGLTAIVIGSQLVGPNYDKIIPATIELILIGRRIDYTPED